MYSGAVARPRMSPMRIVRNCGAAVLPSVSVSAAGSAGAVAWGTRATAGGAPTPSASRPARSKIATRDVVTDDLLSRAGHGRSVAVDPWMPVWTLRPTDDVSQRGLADQGLLPVGEGH